MPKNETYIILDGGLGVEPIVLDLNEFKRGKSHRLMILP